MSASVDLTGMNPLSALFKTTDPSDTDSATAATQSETDHSISFSNDATSVDLDLDEGTRQWARDEVGYIEQSLNELAIIQVLDDEQYAQAASDLADRLDGAASTYAKAGGSSASDEADDLKEKAEAIEESAEESDAADAAAAEAAEESDAADEAAAEDAAAEDDASSEDASASEEAEAADDSDDADDADAADDTDDADESGMMPPPPPGADGPADADDVDSTDEDSGTTASGPAVSQQISAYLATQTPSDRDDAFMAQVKHLAGRIQNTFEEASARVEQQSNGTDLDAENRMDMLSSHMTSTMDHISGALSEISGSGATQASLTNIAIADKTGDGATLKGTLDLSS